MTTAATGAETLSVNNLSAARLGAETTKVGTGIALVVLGMACFVVQDAMMKEMLVQTPVWNLIFTRAAAAVLVVAPLIVILTGARGLRTSLWPLHLARAALFAVGFSLFYAAFPFMGLAEVSTIFFSGPILTAILAALLLGERVGPHRAAGLAVGFAGVLIAMTPTEGAFQWVALAPFGCACTYALSQIVARRIGRREASLTLGLYSMTFAGLLILPLGYLIGEVAGFGEIHAHLRWEWSAPPAVEAVGLLALGLIGLIGYMTLSRAYQTAPASLIAPFDYSYLPMAAALAYLIWGETPGWNTIVGMTLILCGGLYVGYREFRATRPAPAP